MSHTRFRIFSALVLLVMIWLARAEVLSAVETLEDPGRLSSATGASAIALFALLAIAGSFALLIDLRSFPVIPGSFGGRMSFAAGCLVIAAWTYLYSPWQFVLTGAWTHLLFAVAFARMMRALLSPRRDPPYEGSELALTLAVFLFPGVVAEVRLLTGLSLASRTAALTGFLFILALTWALYHPLGNGVSDRLGKMRERLGWVRRPVIVLFWLAPILYHYLAGAGSYPASANIRFLFLLVAVWVTAFLTCEQKDRLVSIDSLGINFGILILVSAIDGYLLRVVDYPFSMYWSEGNRLYDYSLVFGQSLYNYPGKIINPYSSPGRYALWGVLFLFDGLPIWAHRLWNLVLQIAPPLLFSFFLTRRLEPAGLRRRTLLWIALFFIVLAPLHPPFVLGSVIVAWSAFDESPVKRGASLLAAGAYLALSRWTWAFAPAAMGALIDLFLYYPHRTGNWFRRLLPTALLATLGAAPGLYLNFRAFQTTLQGESLTGSQPLLWYRLLPNDTLGPGVLLLTLLYTGPLLIILAWWMVTKRLKLDAWQKLAAWGAILGFFAAGLVISTKIGGGGDLHNLDMYLTTLMLVVVLALTTLAGNPERTPLPAWAAALVALLILLPVHQFLPLDPAYGGEPSSLASPEKAQDILSTIRTEVDAASQQGEVLFMDQRQLLTFGYIPAVPFVPEYEKKYMMDQAMANNAGYFESYYRDLADKRFTLIVTEILRSKLKADLGGSFSEENDAFVTWVSNPTLCFYEPVYTSKETNIMLLVPKADATGCGEYLK